MFVQRSRNKHTNTLCVQIFILRLVVRIVSTDFKGFNTCCFSQLDCSDCNVLTNDVIAFFETTT